MLRNIDTFITSWLLLVHLFAVAALFYVTPGAVILAVVMYVLTACVGITFGFHRLLAHRALKAHPVVEGFAALCGTLSLQMTVREWVGTHRIHHRASDSDRDPHDARKGFWYSHIGWLLIKRPASEKELSHKITSDLAANPWLEFLSRRDVFIGSQIALAFVFFSIGGLPWMLWGIFFRLFFVYHVTWFVNSATHRWGYRNFKTGDSSVNNWWVAILAFGEGWHNNHHRHSSVTSSRYRWWEIDMTYWLIAGLRRVGLVWDLKNFPSEASTDRPKVGEEGAEQGGPQVLRTA